MSDERALNSITLGDLEKILGKQIELAMSQLELRLMDRFALRSEVQGISSAVQLLKDQAVLKGGPLAEQIRRDHELTEMLHDEAIALKDSRTRILRQVEVNTDRLSKMETWRNRMLGMMALITPVATVSFGIVLNRLI